MADILFELPVFAPVEKVFEAVSSPAGLNAWWTQTCSGDPVEGAEYALGFGEGYQWKAVVTKSRPDAEFELEITEADGDWIGTRVGFFLRDDPGRTTVLFHSSGWSEAERHFQISAYCWAMYLRLMKRFAELGEIVHYERRLDA
jgi:uncharacterized protein YndB with AHSA1/START domain